MPKTRVGVFVCHCGNNIGGVVRVPEVVEYARTLPNVVHAEDNLYTCSEEGLSSIRERIADQALNRVVVASCTPRTHEPLFQETLRDAGLNCIVERLGGFGRDLDDFGDAHCGLLLLLN